jgi:branched-chain amino acid transport system ATP-binding protein
LACVLVIPGGIAGRLGALLSVIERWINVRVPGLAPASSNTWGLTKVRAEPSETKMNGEVSHKIEREQDHPVRSVQGTASPLVVKKMSKAYGGVRALQDVSFNLLDGEILGIVGPNGAGKTTLIDVLTGIQSADSGQILLEGQILEGPASERALKGLARTFHHPQLSAELTVGENVGIGLLRLNTPRSWAGMTILMIRSMLPSPWGQKRRGDDGDVVAETALKVGLEDLEEEIASASFGTEKLAEIGRALISKPSVLLMDEPFAGLGKSDIERVIDAIEQWRLHALGVIIVDHNIDLLSKICDRLLVLDSGVAIACGPPKDVLSEPQVQKAYFGGD